LQTRTKTNAAGGIANDEEEPSAEYVEASIEGAKEFFEEVRDEL
jgi:hypothetical protein